MQIPREAAVSVWMRSIDSEGLFERLCQNKENSSLSVNMENVRRGSRRSQLVGMILCYGGKAIWYDKKI